MKAKKKSQRIIRQEQISREVLEQTKRGFKEIEEGKGISLKEALRLLKELRENEEKEPSQRKLKKKFAKKK